MKRVSISIQSRKNPEKVFHGHALTHEISNKQISFFTTQKIPIDEELILSFYFNGQSQVHPVIMKQLHEQISSGRIMNTLPDETNPFPARKFYRCYAWLASTAAQVSSDATPEVATASEVAGETVAAEAAPVDNVTPITAAADAAASLPGVDSSMVFGAEDAAKAAADAAVMDAINSAGNIGNAA